MGQKIVEQTKVVQITVEIDENINFSESEVCQLINKCSQNPDFFKSLISHG